MSKITTSSSKITACPECDSGNLHVSGSEVECISCGWKHTAKPPRPAPHAGTAPEAGNPLTQAPQTQPAPTVQATGASIAAQLAAAITVAPKVKGKRTPRQAPTTSFVLSAKGAAFTPDPKRSKVKLDKNQQTWLTIKALFTAEKPVVTLAEIWAAVPTHKDFVGYAKRSGWLAPAAQ